MNVALLVHFHREDWNLAVGGCAAREFCTYRRAKQNPGVRVPKEKKKFLIGVRQVQWGCSFCGGGGEKTDNCGKPVWQCDRYSIAAPNADGCKGVRHS